MDGDVDAPVAPPADSPALCVLSTNCRSLLPKMDDLRVLAANHRYDLITLTETWLGMDIKECEVSIPS